MPRTTHLSIAVAALLAAAPLAADTLVYDGRPDLSSGLPADIFIPQFDDLDGALTLESVTVESFSSMRGGYVDPHTGQGCVDWHMNIQTDYYLDYLTTPRLINTSDCSVAGQANCVAGGGETAVDVFCSSGWQATVITDPAELAEWIGLGEIIITAEGVIDFGSTNDGLIGFGAGGSAQYKVTFTYSEGAPCLCETDGNAAQIDVFDLLAYLDGWFLADAAADIDGTPGVDVFDLLAFLDCWFTGC